jgi:ribose transport system substrate-binding protein
MTIVSSQSGYWEMDKANQVVAALITEHPTSRRPLRQRQHGPRRRGRPARCEKLESVKVVGYDNIAAAQQLLQEGHLLATADQHADQLAVFGIEYALEMLKSNVAPADRQTPVELVTR